MIFLKLLKRISNYFDRIEHDIRLFNLKPSLILGGIVFGLGIFSWIIGGSSDRVMLMYLFPRCAISIGFLYFLWGLSFFFIGIVMGGLIFGCEKYKRRETMKIIAFVVLSLILSLCVHPMFFRCLAPFITSAILLFSALFCFLAITSAAKLYSLWSICLMLHFAWLLYNCYITFAIALIN